MTKVLQVPFCFYPDPIGGTEVYVASLTRQLQKRGIEVVIAAPGEQDDEYCYDNTCVRRFALDELVGPRELYGIGDPVAADTFGRILDEERPDLVHLHGFTRGLSLLMVREIKRRGIPVILTYHVATVSCTQGSMMRWDTERCSGMLNLDLCTRCTLHGLGMPRSLTQIVGRVPVLVGKTIAKMRESGKAVTALRMREFIDLRHQTFHALMAEVDHLIGVCDWVKSILVLNGVPAEKISVSRYGLPQMLDESVRQRSPLPAEQIPLRIVFLGRIDPIKGVDILIQVFRSLPDAPMQLDLIGVVQGMAGIAYLEKLKALAFGDSRINFLPGVPNHEVPSVLKNYHLIAVPSRVQDVSPIVMLEAHAVGVPIMASAVGGIPELIKHEVNGLLVKPDSVSAWREALKCFIDDRTLLSKLRAGISSPRGMDIAADEIVSIYQNLFARANLQLCNIPA